MFITALFTIADFEPTQMPISVRLDKESVAIRNDEFASFVGTWMNLENIILSKLTQEQKMKHRIFSLIGG